MSSREVETVRSWLEKLDRSGPVAAAESIAEVSTEDTLFEVPALGLDIRGGAELVRFFHAFAEGGEDARATVYRIDQDGDGEVVLAGTLRRSRDSDGFSEAQMAVRVVFDDGHLASLRVVR